MRHAFIYGFLEELKKLAQDGALPGTVSSGAVFGNAGGGSATPFPGNVLPRAARNRMPPPTGVTGLGPHTIPGEM